MDKGGEATMEVEARVRRDAAPVRAVVRCGRPPREHAGMVEERILDAAGRVFLERGFSGASVDEIAEAACAGKPTIYARFPSKEALFTAVIERLVRKNTSYETVPGGASFQDRLQALAVVMLNRVLADETIGLIRVAVAEARRFPELASRVSRTARERQIEAVSRLLAEFAGSDRTGRLIAFAADSLPEKAQRFIQLTVMPMLLRALFGEDVAALRDEINAHAESSVGFFLAACRCAEGNC